MKQLLFASATLRPVPSAAMDRVAAPIVTGEPGNRNGSFVVAAAELVIIETANKRN